jgi:hypothetical protein
MDRPPHEGAGRGASHDPLGENSPSPEELPDSILSEEDQDRRKTAKRAATATAKLALIGAQVHPLESGGYLATCGGFHRRFQDIEQLYRFAMNPGARD